MEYKYQHTSMKKPDGKYLEESRGRLASILAHNVCSLRKHARFTKRAFALMVGIGRPFLDRIENGSADVRLSVLVRLADALETTPGHLLIDHEKGNELTSPDSAASMDSCTSSAQINSSPMAYRVPETSIKQNVPVWNPWNY